MADEEISTIERKAFGCPLDPVLNFLALKWLVHIVWFLGHKESLRFAELQRQLPGRVSAKVLSARLKQLEKLTLVEREEITTKPLQVVYPLTAYGRTVNELLIGLELRTRQLPLPEAPLVSSAKPPAKTSAKTSSKTSTKMPAQR
jgi:DNA-binding HxlR family transcriptional regulator